MISIRLLLSRALPGISVRAMLTSLIIWLVVPSFAVAWGPVTHAVIGHLAENDLLKRDPGLKTLLTQFRQPGQRQRIKRALLGMAPPASGEALHFFANWPDVKKRQSGMLPYDGLRHFVNLPHRARYSRIKHCPHGACSIETLLQQRAILANWRTPLSQRAIALAWIVHLVGDLHQPLHAGKAKDRGANLICVTWRERPSRLATVNGKLKCSGANLH
ncbi:MAG: S1/P1 nuclease, partial [Candidatus Tectomicrobia bacterium]